MAAYISTVTIWILSAAVTYMLWAVTWDWTKDLLRSPSTAITSGDVHLVRDAADELLPRSGATTKNALWTTAPFTYPLEGALLYSPQEDGRYKVLCTTCDTCLPLEEVRDHINQHGTKRKEP